jgi:glucose-6-phosphate-specific signal transduction histidine kinase
LFLRKRNLTILLALLAALLTAAALLAALLPTLASGLLLLLTGLLLTALLAALLLLPALLHVAHFVVRHRELSFAETFRGRTISLNASWFPQQTVALGSNAGTHRNKDQPVVSSNYRHAGVLTHSTLAK